MGSKGWEEVKEHPWFKNYPWSDLLEKKIDAPFIPEKQDNFDKKYCIAEEKIGNETRARYEKYKMDDNFPLVFLNYTYVGNISP